MPRWIFTVALLLLAGIFFLEEKARADHVEVGDMAPLFSCKTLDGDDFSLLTHRGKTVVLSFWTTWCYKCRDEMVFLQEISKDYSDSVVIVGISEETQHFGTPDLLHIERLMEEWGIRFPTLLDEGKKIWDAYGMRTVPSSIIIDFNGRIQFVETYFFTGSEESMKFLLRLLDDARTRHR